MSLLINDRDFQLYVGDVRAVLRELPAESVHCVVTSPPYWGLRDYGTGVWEGGDPGCDHRKNDTGSSSATSRLRLDGRTHIGPYPEEKDTRKPYSDVCGKCGATRVDRQIGLEATPDLYVAAMVDVFREIRRVLRRDGTCWVNLGDSYAASPTGNRGTKSALHGAQTSEKYQDTLDRYTDAKLQRAPIPDGLKPKDLVGIPWRVAFVLQADGWYLRADIIWAKPNPMPESVTDRPTKSHEYVFLLTRSPRYFFDQEAVREAAAWERWGDQTVPKHGGTDTGAGWIKARTKTDLRNERTADALERGSWDSGDLDSGKQWPDGRKTGRDTGNGSRNIRSVWEIATQPFSGSALGHGSYYRASAGCPVHGLLAVPERWRRAARGEPQDPFPYRIDGNDARLALELHGGSDPSSSRNSAPPSTAPPSEPQPSPQSIGENRTHDASSSADDPAADAGTPGRTGHNEGQAGLFPDSSGSLSLERVPTATPHSSGTRRTAPAPATTEPCTPSARTPGRTGDTSALPEPSGSAGRKPVSSTSEGSGEDATGSDPSVGTVGRSGRSCTCAQVSVDHFATFPEALAERCILAGSSERGCCPVCGAPWVREVAATYDAEGRTTNGPRSTERRHESPGRDVRMVKDVTTTGWRPSCGCDDGSERTTRLPPVPCTVLDPFIGSGTTALVARKLGRRSIGVELNPEYARLAARRLQQLSLFAGAPA